MEDKQFSKTIAQDLIRRCVIDLIFYSLMVVVNAVAIGVLCSLIKNKENTGLQLILIVVMAFCCGYFFSEILSTGLKLHHARKQYELIKENMQEVEQ